MRLAWVCNKAPLPVSRAAGIDGGVFGGWLDSTASSLLGMDGTELLVLFPCGEEVSGHAGALSFCSFSADVQPSWFADRLEAFKPRTLSKPSKLPASWESMPRRWSRFRALCRYTADITTPRASPNP